MPRTLRNAIITIALTFAVFMLSTWLRFGEWFSGKIETTHFAFSLSVITFICGLIWMLARSAVDNEEIIKETCRILKDEQEHHFSKIIQHTAKYADGIADALAQEHSFRVIGTPADAIQYIFSNMEDVTSVDNTYIRFKDYSRIDDSLYPKNWHLDIVSKIKDFCVSRGTSRVWRDVVSTNEERKYAITLKLISDPDVRSYYAKIVDEAPIMNYIILHRQDFEKEVLFGWASMRDYPTNILVFSSKNADLANYFAQHFNMLFNAGRDFREL